MKKNFTQLTPDGAMGYIEDVTNKEWYKNPDITLYDGLEQSAYNLICDFAELIGVHLDKNEPDFYLAKEVTGQIMDMLEKEFNIPFPLYNGELNKVVEQEVDLIESNDKGFDDNESCAFALFNYLVSKKEIENTPESLDEIIHDINNLRGHEWLQGMARNLETKKFFDYIGFPEFNDEGFVLNRAISPSYYYKVASDGVELTKEPTLEELRVLMDENGLDILWDYIEEDLDEALSNNDYIVAVGFYEKDGYSVSFFECPEKMAEVFWENEHIDNCKDSLDIKIQAAGTQISKSLAESYDKEFNNILLTDKELSLIENSLDYMGDRIADAQGFSAGEVYWDLRDKIHNEPGRLSTKDTKQLNNKEIEL